MSRAVALNDACRTLKLPYTYQIASVSAAKQVARRQLGNMSAEIIESMRDELVKEAVKRYLRSQGLTQQQVDTILGGGNGTGTTRVDIIELGVAKRESEAAPAAQEARRPEPGDREHAGSAIDVLTGG